MIWKDMINHIWRGEDEKIFRKKGTSELEFEGQVWR